MYGYGAALICIKKALVYKRIVACQKHTQVALLISHASRLLSVSFIYVELEISI